MLCSVDWLLAVSVLGQSVGSVFKGEAFQISKGQAAQEMLVPASLHCVTSQKIKNILYNVAET
jgi:hypothetical protein